MAVSTAHGQSGASDAGGARKELRAIPRGDQEIVIDGRLDEPIWAQAPPGTDFVQRIPTPGVPSPSPTEFRVVYDDKALYFGVTSHLRPGRSAPRALVLTRDSNRIWYDNVILIKIDPLRDQRTSIEFGINANGAQIDAISLDNGKVYRVEFDALFSARASRSPGAWHAEFRIPYAALNIPAISGEHVMGVNVSVVDSPGIHLWNPIPPPFPFPEARLYGDIVGLAHLGGGHPLSIRPYLALHMPEHANDLSLSSGANAVGLAGGLDVTSRVSDGMWAELSLATDFAQSDLDDRLVNLDRFPLFIPEKRTFFLAGLDIFEFGIPGRVQPFFTRRIGLDAAGQRVPVLGGIKLYGHVGDVGIGVLDVVTDEQDVSPLSNWSVARLRWNVNDDAHVGVLLTGMHTRAIPGGTSATQDYFAGVDAAVRTLGGRLGLSGFAGTNADLQSSSDIGLFSGASAQWLGSALAPDLSILWVGSEFAPAMGFVQRTGFVEGQGNIPWTLRPDDGPLQELTVRMGGRYLADSAGLDPLGYAFTPGLSLDIRGGFRAAFSWERVHDVVAQDFELLPGIIVPAAAYDGMSGVIEFGTLVPRLPEAWLSYRVQSGFFGGQLHNLQGSISGLYLSKHLELSGSGSLAHITIPGYEPEITYVVNLAAGIRPRADLGLDAVYQRSSINQQHGGMLRLRWRYLPGSDLFAIYQQNTESVPDGRSLTVKLVYRYDALL